MEGDASTKSLFSLLRVASHAGRVAPGGTFVAIRGARVDGILFIPEAISRGAARVVIARTAQLSVEVEELLAQQNVQLVRVDEPRRALAELSAEAYGYPAQKMCMVGITGTKGKTTTSHMLFHVLRTSGIKAALLSTVYNQILDERYETELTTQQPDYLHAFLAAAAERGVTHVVIEVAAQALSLHRVMGLQFRVVVWTNFSPEHGEFYASTEDYFTAKYLLLSQVVRGGCVVLNGDDVRIARAKLPTGVKRICFSRSMVVDDLSRALHHPHVALVIGEQLFRCAALLGAHHGENGAACVLAARELGISDIEIAGALATFPGVPGRANFIALKGGVVACIDYAHTPDGVRGILETLRHYTEQLLVVTGCGGDRDRLKRPVIGAYAAHIADRVILTTDNPRSESPMAICQDMYAGIPEALREKVAIELDRECAIERAYVQARPGALIALLGKGPDEYQMIGIVKQHFSERAILARWQEVW